MIKNTTDKFMEKNTDKQNYDDHQKSNTFWLSGACFRTQRLVIKKCGKAIQYILKNYIIIPMKCLESIWKN